MQRLEELPLPAMLAIVELAEDGFCAHPLAKKTALNAPRLWQLAAVSTSWARAVRALLESLQDTNVTLKLHVFSASSTTASDAKGVNNNGVVPFRTFSAAERPLPQYAIRMTQAEPASPSWLLARILRGLLSFIYSPQPQRQRQLERNHQVKETTVVNNPEEELDAEYVVINTSATLASEVVRFQRTLANKQVLALKISWLTPDISDINEDVALDWGIVFSQCVKLQRLDLSEFPIMSSQLIAILLAASAHCKTVKVLIMPQQDCLGYQKRDIKPVFDAMYAALSKWQQQSLIMRLSLSQSGLHKLILPKLYPYEYSDEHMANITIHCPALDYIEGLRLAPIFPNSRQTNEQVLESWISAWREFCRACPSIREFSWLDLPFIDDLFVLFAAEPKLTLENLTLPGNTALWKRDYLFRERQAATSFQCTPGGIQSVLQACLNLRKLEVIFSDRQVTFGNEDQLVVDDAFLQVLSRSCCDLQELRLVESSAHHGFDVTNTVTDIGFTALASLSNLRHVEMNGVDCSAQGLLALMTHPFSLKVPQRSANITIGGRGSQKFNLPAKFNHLVEDFLLLALDQGSDLHQLWPRFSITFRIDSCNQQLPILWESSYLPKWKQLKQRIERKLPQLQFSYDLVHEIKVRWIPFSKHS